jgi:hypothetical protein
LVSVPLLSETRDAAGAPKRRAHARTVRWARAVGVDLVGVLDKATSSHSLVTFAAIRG